MTEALTLYPPPYGLMPVIAHREWRFEDPLVVVGFPSQGLVGAIVASYLVPKLEMELVASMDSPHFPPVASIRDGHAMSPVQFFASTQRCGLDGECDQLVVVRADTVPPPKHSDPIAREIIEWSKQVGAERIVTLEGAPAENGTDHVFAVPNLLSSVDHEHLGSKTFPDGALSGLSASLLVEGNSQSMEVVCLFTSAHEDVPDAAAAARLVEVLDVLVPGIKMDAEPLLEQAKRFEQQLRAHLQEQQRAEGDPTTQMMYG